MKALTAGTFAHSNEYVFFWDSFKTFILTQLVFMVHTEITFGSQMNRRRVFFCEFIIDKR